MKRRSFVYVLAILAGTVLLSSCESSNQEIVTMFLAPHKAACGESALCLVVRDEGDEAYRLMSHIEGFRFRWGYDYELRVELKRDRTFGGVATRYVMSDVVERDAVPAGTGFDLCMVTSMLRAVDLEANRGWIGEEQREFTFDEAVQPQFEAFQEKGFGLASFEFQADVDDPMILIAMSVDLETPCEGPIPEYVPEDGGEEPVP